MKNAVILYVPALHEGYIRFLSAHKNETIYLVSDKIRSEIASEISYYGRDIRAIPSSQMSKVLKSLEINNDIRELDRSAIDEIKKAGVKIIMPDEDISHEIAKKFFGNTKINFESVFLRWDKKISTTEFQVAPNRIISKEEFDREMIGKAIAEGDKSSDWWRRVGAVFVKDGEALLATHNIHMPRPDNNHVLGDPRSNFEAGDASTIGISTAFHAEASLVADAAKSGISLADTHLYVSTFPCPNCARLIARSGVKKIFYASGYSLVDAEDILKTSGVEIVLVEISSPKKA